MRDAATTPVWMRRFPGVAVSLGRSALDMVLPPRCPETGSIVVGPGGLAADAWR